MKYIHSIEPIGSINLGQLITELYSCDQRLITINPMALTIFNKKKYSEQTPLKALQYFCNAYILETAFIECNEALSFVTSDHEEILATNTGKDEPDFRLKSGKLHGETVELKIFWSEAEISFDQVQDADYVICYLLTSQKYFTYHVDHLEPKAFIDPLEGLNYPNYFTLVQLCDHSPNKNGSLVYCKLYDHNETSCVRRTELEPYSFDPKNGSDDPDGYGYDDSDLDLEESYSNALDLSKALTNKADCIQLIREKYGYEGPIKTGGFYIMPDGSAVKSENHADIDKFLIKNGYISGKVEDYGDGSQFMDAINCVRIRRRGGSDTWLLPYMILPENQLTAAQYEVLENWVSFVLSSSGSLSVQTLTGKCKNYHYGDSAKQVITDIRIFYKTAVLEGFEYELLYEPDVDQTDYKLEYALQNGFYDQF